MEGFVVEGTFDGVLLMLAILAELSKGRELVGRVSEVGAVDVAVVEAGVLDCEVY